VITILGVSRGVTSCHSVIICRFGARSSLRAPYISLIAAPLLLLRIFQLVSWLIFVEETDFPLKIDPYFLSLLTKLTMYLTFFIWDCCLKVNLSWVIDHLRLCSSEVAMAEIRTPCLVIFTLP